MQTVGYNRYNNTNTENATTFERTNYALKESVNKEWRLYNLSGMCEIKPYPVFINGQPCASRNPSTMEAIEGFDPSLLKGAEYDQYHGEIIPDAYVQTTMANYVGITGNHYTFIDQCSDIEKYIQDAVDVNKVATPYTAMVRTLYKNMPKPNEPVTPGTPACLLRARSEGTMAYSRTVVLFRGMLMKFKGQSINTKNAVQGTLPKTIFAISQKSAIDAFIRAFRTKESLREPLSHTNNQMAGSLNLDGTILSFSKSNYADKSSDYLLTPIYNPVVNQLVAQVWNAQNEQDYYANLYNSFGACQNLTDALEIMTVEEMITLLRKAFPASWVWYGLRDTPYAPMVQDLAAEAAQDREMTAWFNPQPNNPVIPQNAYVTHAPQQQVQAAPTHNMPSIADLPPQPTADAVPMSFNSTPVNNDQQKADDVMARIKARVNTLQGGN